MNNSPLRYPGGKAKILPLIEAMILKINYPVEYIEPFVGGGGVALGLLYNNIVDSVIINDFDKAIYSVWKAILTETDKFIDLISKAEFSIDEWKKQKNIYLTYSKKYSLEFAFATFYLNRTNRSGIITAGPIGGYEQVGKYKINARFNKEALIQKIKKISSYKTKIKLYNLDISAFMKKVIPNHPNHFIYFDPPYFNKGEELYKNFFNLNDHIKLGNEIRKVKDYWMVTYDDASEIKNIYNNYSIKKFFINHSAANSGKSKEILFLSNENIWLNINEINKLKMPINFEEENN